MIAFLNGRIIEKDVNRLTLDVQGVGYEVFCSARTVEALCDAPGDTTQIFTYTHYRSEGAALYGFLTREEKSLFLELLKVDSVGPKSALNILSAAPWFELVQLIEEGDASSLSKLPKVGKKAAEHIVVKLKGKLSALALQASGAETGGTSVSGIGTSGGARAGSRLSEVRRLRAEAQFALTHLGYKTHEVERVLNDIEESVWAEGFQTVLRHALGDLAGNL